MWILGLKGLTKAPSIQRKVGPGKRVAVPAESTLASVYSRITSG